MFSKCQKKSFDLSMLEGDKYYYLEGSASEIMSIIRLRQYAEGILKSNLDDDTLPDKFKKSISGLGDYFVNDEDIPELIHWMGEDIFEIS